ncbi:hypothetical protein K7432_018603 [Basidiobolus ranarum]|uniref:EXPERA domain-containing protein n=1 Tax=Basidiobolus ranarum TaxID=34480 RepID=A0ABR2VIR8_9FUNG
MVQWKSNLFFACLSAAFVSMTYFDVLCKLMEELTPHRPVMFDPQLSYSSHDIQPLLKALGEQGRSLYLKVYYLDFALFPFFYGAIMFLSLDYLQARKIRWLTLFASVMDMLENSCVVYLILHFDTVMPYTHSAEFLLPYLTSAKWIGFATNIVLVLFYFILRMFQQIADKIKSE